METENKAGYITELPIEIQRMFKNLDFPIEKKGIIEQARKSKAIPDILRELGMLPDKKYNSAEDIAEELHKTYMGVPV
jgi:ABC-type antimicrobial peptide transport system ATPase subunit